MMQEEQDQAQADALLNTAKLHEQIIDIGNACTCGWLNPLECLVELKRLANTVANAELMVKDYAIEEAEKHGKEFEFNGVKFAVRNSGSRWDYSSVQKITEYKDKIKHFEKLSQMAAAEAKHGKVIFDDDGIEITPATYNEGRTNIFVTLPKHG